MSRNWRSAWRSRWTPTPRILEELIAKGEERISRLERLSPTTAAASGWGTPAGFAPAARVKSSRARRADNSRRRRFRGRAFDGRHRGVSVAGALSTRSDHGAQHAGARRGLSARSITYTDGDVGGGDPQGSRSSADGQGQTHRRCAPLKTATGSHFRVDRHEGCQADDLEGDVRASSGDPRVSRSRQNLDDVAADDIRPHADRTNREPAPDVNPPTLACRCPRGRIDAVDVERDVRRCAAEFADKRPEHPSLAARRLFSGNNRHAMVAGEREIVSGVERPLDPDRDHPAVDDSFLDRATERARVPPLAPDRVDRVEVGIKVLEGQAALG